MGYLLEAGGGQSNCNMEISDCHHSEKVILSFASGLLTFSKIVSSVVI